MRWMPWRSGCTGLLRTPAARHVEGRHCRGCCGEPRRRPVVIRNVDENLHCVGMRCLCRVCVQSVSGRGWGAAQAWRARCGAPAVAGAVQCSFCGASWSVLCVWCSRLANRACVRVTFAGLQLQCSGSNAGLGQAAVCSLDGAFQPLVSVSIRFRQGCVCGLHIGRASLWAFIAVTVVHYLNGTAADWLLH